MSDTFKIKKRPPPLKAYTPTQKTYLKKLKQAHHDILIVAVPAGTGKTYMAVRHAINELQNGDITKIIITRPLVTTGNEDLGALPGTLIEKMAPWTRPIIDVFAELYEVHEINRMLADEIIEIAPLAYMLGRTFKNCIVIADEMQNATPEQMEMFMTRIGTGCRQVITGDTKQYDEHKVGKVSGLDDIIRKIEDKREQDAADRTGLPSFITGEDESDETGQEDDLPSDVDHDDLRHELIGLVKFTKSDVRRHRVIPQVLALFGK